VNINESGGDALQDIIIGDEVECGGLGCAADEVIVYADICKAWVALLTSTGGVCLLSLFYLLF
jgi:hypothetical protein